MNLVKSILSTCHIISVFCFAIDSLLHLFNQFSTAWLGAVLATTAPCGYFLYLFLNPKPRTQRYINLVISLIAIGACITIIGSVGTLSGHTLALSYVIVTLMGWIAYEFWFSKFANNISAKISYGEILPEFTLKNHQSEDISSISLIGTPTIIMFYRGNWCPFSLPLINELIGTLKSEDNSILPIFISSQPLKKIQELASQVDSKALFLFDKNNLLAKKFDIELKFSTPFGLQLFGYYTHSALPTIIMTDTKSKIIYSDIADSFRVYSNPKSYVQLLKQLPAE